MKTTLITLLLSVAAVLGYLSYRALSPVPAPAPSPAPAEAPGETYGHLAERLPDFALPNLAGEEQSIRSWPGKALVINFWATWCPPCLREIPLLKEFQDAHPDVQVVGIAVDRRDAVSKFADDMDFNYPVLVGQAAATKAAAALGVDFVGLPFTVFTDGQGRVLGVHTGQLEAAHLDNLAGLLSQLQSGAIDVDAVRARLAGRM
jgi:thiol-disulfide isomerase/thioredoxin